MTSIINNPQNSDDAGVRIGGTFTTGSTISFPDGQLSASEGGVMVPRSV